VSLSAAFTDPGSSDTHQATIDWGDGVKTAGTITAGKISASHVYQTGGVFFISLSLKDDDGGADAKSTVAYVTGFRIEKGVLQIVGTSRADSVVIAAPQNNSAQVQANFLPGRRGTFKPASVSKIEVYLGAGNDRFSLHRNYKQPLLVVGGAGADEITAGSGRSVLIGGAGADHLIGGSNQDLLIAGTTAFDNNVVALRGILAEWSSGRSLKNRVANLFDGSGAGPRANGNNFLTVGAGGTVSHDSASDTLKSGNSIDWLFYDPRRDRLRGRATDDLFANKLDELLGRAS
jgi:hypothetical protein